jgi:hypothetical protein
MFLLIQSNFKTDKIKLDEGKPCEGWCTIRPCDRVATKKVKVVNCGCKIGEYWLCDECQKEMK